MQERETVASFGELFTRVRVLLGPDYVERTELDGSALSRRRVFFDEVRLLSLHRERRWAPLVIALAIALGFGFLALALPEVEPAARWTVVAIGAFVLGLGLAGALLPRQVVTVQGPRSRLRILLVSAARARALYARLGELVATAQAGESEPAPPPAAPPPPELLPPG